MSDAPPMEALRDELRRISDENREEKQKEHDADLVRAIDGLFQEIIGQAEPLMRNDALEGHTHSVVYRYPKNGMWENYPVQFLLHGPQVDRGHGVGEAFFENKNTCGCLQKLRQYFAPMPVKRKFNRLRQENIVLVYW